MDGELFDEILLKDIEIAEVIERRTGLIEGISKKFIRKEYRSCVLEDRVSLSCMKEKERRLPRIGECVAKGFFQLCFGYKDCVKMCLQEGNDRVYCLENCREVLIKALEEADLEELTEKCVVGSLR